MSAFRSRDPTRGSSQHVDCDAECPTTSETNRAARELNSTRMRAFYARMTWGSCSTHPVFCKMAGEFVLRLFFWPAILPSVIDEHRARTCRALVAVIDVLRHKVSILDYYFGRTRVRNDAIVAFHICLTRLTQCARRQL